MPTDAPPPSAGPTVAVLGNLCWDVLVRGLPAMPAWGEEVEGTDSLQAPGGQGYNVAAALCGLGVGARLIGAVGCDPAGEAIVASAQALGVDVSDVAVDPAWPTAVTAS